MIETLKDSVIVSDLSDNGDSDRIVLHGFRYPLALFESDVLLQLQKMLSTCQTEETEKTDVF